MRAVFAGGGTAGHLYPALAVAQRFRRQVPGAEAHFLAARRPLDAELMAQHGLDHRLLAVTGIPYGFSLQTVAACTRLLRGACQAWRAYAAWRPAVVFGAGGYVSAAAVPPAAWRRLPIVIHVSDAQPDRTNLALARYARTITVAFEAAARHFPAHKTVITGQPVREEILATDRATARRELGYEDSDFVLLVTGGSQGARSINQALVAALPRLARAAIRVYHLTGHQDYDNVVAATRGLELGDSYLVRAYEAQMGWALAAADLVVMRAGSSSLAEAAAWGLPMVLIPYPHAGGHQRENALPLVDSGAALMVDDRELTGDWLADTVCELVRDAARRDAMAAAARAWGSREAADRVAEQVVRAGGGLGDDYAQDASNGG
ncbi:MAG: undecaprenyldiphospho-muramoylpentapeptide beta-N-acetylglucosaminyltransferase [Armatimonadetes bacterium]|nr:undecaprenyldiphospho-muramoylpentapeptide beta-N-acetylglucosaminyltransferase [Armatimonadota bacterium]